MNLEAKSMDEVRRMARQKESATDGGQPVGEQRKQSVVEMSEVAKRLDEGWEFVEKLSDKQVIVRSPPSA
jgi:threonine dehydratase